MEKKKEAKKIYRDLSLKQLVKELAFQEKELAELYKKQTLSKLDNYYKIVKARKNLARLKTFIRSRELSAGSERRR